MIDYNNKPNTINKIVSIKIESDALDKLIMLAKNNHRTLSNQIVCLIYDKLLLSNKSLNL